MSFFTRLLLCAILVVPFISASAQEYYLVPDIAKAKAEARARHLPIAWLSSHVDYLQPSYANAKQGSEIELTLLALNTLQGQAVVVFQNGDVDLPTVPPLIQNQIEAMDEGPIPGGFHYHVPKILYTDPEITTYFDHTLAPDMQDERETAIQSALSRVHHNPAFQALIDGPANPPASAPVATATDTSTSLATNAEKESTLTDKLLGAFAPYLIYIAAAVIFLIILMGYLAWRGRPTATPPEQY